uniref:Uncharacterized protein n=1 Tax=Medicago truncatula TaxID=3880 RepID=A2Q3Q1_MEDTR|nr:hypothetical protein MtrDRAFT_AC155886g36v2 [Medicago truncatula]
MVSKKLDLRCHFHVNGMEECEFSDTLKNLLLSRRIIMR